MTWPSLPSRCTHRDEGDDDLKRGDALSRPLMFAFTKAWDLFNGWLESASMRCFNPPRLGACVLDGIGHAAAVS
jgi:hypothetical protein